MIVIAQIVGLLAVITFFLSYQQKTRKRILIWNFTARALYIIQYFMLGAFEGVIINIVGIACLIIAQNKETKFIKNHLCLFVVVTSLLMIAAGLLSYRNIFSLCPILGALLHTGAFWITREKTIRQVSLIGSPFWFIYNISSKAYGSAVGDIMTLTSIITAMYRYDLKKER